VKYGAVYDPTWGRVKAITRPIPGNHEYGTAGAAGYFAYFGAAAGGPGASYYSFDLGGWHLVALDSNCGAVGGCGPGSPEEVWLAADLAAHAGACTLAYWHHPRFSSGPHGDDPTFVPFWADLHAARADVVLNGHDHDYERFAPQTPTGAPDPVNGIREFVVGTGGGSHETAGTPIASSEVLNATTFGVLKLTLHTSSYDFAFLPVAGSTFTDSGTGVPCH
jgi:acid phosphatase type 7